MPFDHPHHRFLSCSRATSDQQSRFLLEYRRAARRNPRCKCSSTRPSPTQPSSPCVCTLQPCRDLRTSRLARQYPARSNISGRTRARCRPHGRDGDEDQQKQTSASLGYDTFAGFGLLWRTLEVGSATRRSVDAVQIDTALETRSGTPRRRRSTLGPHDTALRDIDAAQWKLRFATWPSLPNSDTALASTNPPFLSGYRLRSHCCINV